MTPPLPGPGVFSNFGVFPSAPSPIIAASSGDTIRIAMSFRSPKKFVNGKPRLRDDRSYRAARNVTWIAWNHGQFAGGAIDPDFVATLSRPQKLETVAPKM